MEGTKTFPGSRFFTAFQYGDFRTLWFANLFAGAAAWALIVVRGWLVFTLTGSSAWVGVVTFAAMIPRVFVTPFAGLLADRMDRGRLLVWTYGINLMLGLTLLALVATGMIQLWHLVVLAFLNGSVRAAQMPASQSLTPNLVPRKDLLNAIALNSAAMHGSRLVGPGLIAPLLAGLSANVAVILSLLLCTGFYAAGLFQVAHIRTPSRGVVDPAKGVVQNMLTGLTYLYRHYVLGSLIILVALHCALTMSFESLFPVLSRDSLGAGGGGFSYLMMAVGAGALVGVMGLAGVRSEGIRGRLFLTLGVLSGLSLVGLAHAPNLPIAMALAAGMGASQAAFMTFSATVTQSIVPDGIRGRVAGVYNWQIGGLMASVNLVNGTLADTATASTLLTIEGLAFIVIVAVSLLRLPLRRLYTSGVPAEARAAVPAGAA